jgi:hypothetical protein
MNMNTSSTRSGSHRRRTRRTLTAASAIAASGALLAVSASSASAWSLPTVCSGAAAANACLSGYTPGNHMIQIHVGIDVHMSKQDADAILAQPGNAFSARMWGSDPTFDDWLDAPLTLTWEASWDGGISAEFDTLVPAWKLDEDDSWLDNKDDLFARVTLRDLRSGNRSFDTPQWHIYADAQ